MDDIDAMANPDELPKTGTPAPEGEPDVERVSDEAADDAREVSPLEASEQRVAELEDRLKRQEAEFLNETRRIRKQSDEQGRFAIERVVVDLLPVMDALDSAANALGDSEEDRRVREGLDLVEAELARALSRYGVERIDALGQPFDPALHQAMMMVDDPTRPAQTVSQVMRHGFTLHGRVVRPAEVLVVKGAPRADGAEPADAPTDEEGDV